MSGWNRHGSYYSLDLGGEEAYQLAHSLDGWRVWDGDRPRSEVGHLGGTADRPPLAWATDLVLADLKARLDEASDRLHAAINGLAPAAGDTVYVLEGPGWGYDEWAVAERVVTGVGFGGRAVHFASDDPLRVGAKVFTHKGQHVFRTRAAAEAALPKARAEWEKS